MTERRPLGTGPAADTPTPPGPRARLAAEPAQAAPAAEATGPADRSAAAPGRRRLGSGTATAGH